MISDDKRANSLDTGNIKLTYNSVSIGIMIPVNFSGVQWLSGRVLNLGLRGPWSELHLRHRALYKRKTLYPHSLILVQQRKTS